MMWNNIKKKGIQLEVKENHKLYVDILQLNIDIFQTISYTAIWGRSIEDKSVHYFIDIGWDFTDLG